MGVTSLAWQHRLTCVFFICLLGACAQPRITVKRVVGLEYPRLAALAAVQGKVELVALISPDGSVSEVRVVSAHILLREPAKETLSQWKFAGCEASQSPCEVRVVFDFVLEGLCDKSWCGTRFAADLPSFVEIKSKVPPAIID
jgi:hypothetical protein